MCYMFMLVISFPLIRGRHNICFDGESHCYRNVHGNNTFIVGDFRAVSSRFVFREKKLIPRIQTENK